MTPLPAPLGAGDLVAWRLDTWVFRASWDSGEGAWRAGGRWNRAGARAVYCSLDPATAILEVAANKGFESLDVVPHVLTKLTIVDPAAVFVVMPDDVPNPNWLVPGRPGAGQQAFGDLLLSRHGFVALPSVVSRRSWNLIFNPLRAAGLYRAAAQERFALDPPLRPPRPPLARSLKNPPDICRDWG